jgi:hypothetical protein
VKSVILTSPGPGQINDEVWEPTIRKFGYTRRDVINDGCLNVEFTAYILRLEYYRTGHWLKAVGNYKSRTPHLHRSYREDVREDTNRLKKAPGRVQELIEFLNRPPG